MIEPVTVFFIGVSVGALLSSVVAFYVAGWPMTKRKARGGK